MQTTKYEYSYYIFFVTKRVLNIPLQSDKVTIFNLIYCGGLNSTVCVIQGKDVPLNMFYADRITGMQINPLILSLVNSDRNWTQLEKIHL